MKILRYTLIAQIVFFVLWGGYLILSYGNAETIWLETEPVDPRDLLSGHYVALRYSISTPKSETCKLILNDEIGQNRYIYMHISKSGKTLNALGEKIYPYEDKSCQKTPPATNAKGIWIRGELTPKLWGGGRQIRLGIERFYVSEESLLRNVRSGDVVAKVAVNKSREPRILDLVPVQNNDLSH
ncbi:MAG: GDYXXLXY domain-containing protein [Nitrospirae bacterium]|nr:GDYXXLXY domain-containing protein [Nitrospirota bacterium]